MIAFLIFGAMERARVEGIDPTTVYLGNLDYNDLMEEQADAGYAASQSYVMRQVNKLTIVVEATPRKIEIEGTYHEHNGTT